METLALVVLTGVVLLIPLYSILYAVSHAAAGACELGAAALPRLDGVDFSAIAASVGPILSFAKVVSQGILDGNLTSSNGPVPTFEAAWLHEPVAVDLSPFCDSAGAVLGQGQASAARWALPFDCAAALNSTALTLAAVPLFAAASQPDYYAALLPVCDAAESYVSSLDTFCRSAPWNAKPPEAMYVTLIGATTSFYATLDAALTFIFANPNTATFPEYLVGINITSYTELANALDAIDYASMYPIACNAIIGLDYWFFVMFCGIWLHLPPAVLAWHFIYKYTQLMEMQDQLIMNKNPQYKIPAGYPPGQSPTKELV